MLPRPHTHSISASLAVLHTIAHTVTPNKINCTLYCFSAMMSSTAATAVALVALMMVMHAGELVLAPCVRPLLSLLLHCCCCQGGQTVNHNSTSSLLRRLLPCPSLPLCLSLTYLPLLFHALPEGTSRAQTEQNSWQKDAAPAKAFCASPTLRTTKCGVITEAEGKATIINQCPLCGTLYRGLPDKLPTEVEGVDR